MYDSHCMNSYKITLQTITFACEILCIFYHLPVKNQKPNCYEK